jgi:hypothetical protein
MALLKSLESDAPFDPRALEDMDQGRAMTGGANRT